MIAGYMTVLIMSYSGTLPSELKCREAPHLILIMETATVVKGQIALNVLIALWLVEIKITNFKPIKVTLTINEY